jgi:chromate reductase
MGDWMETPDHETAGRMPAGGLRILGISGSLRRDSINRRLLRAAAHRLPSGVELVELDPAILKAVPNYDQDDDHDEVAAEVTELREAIAGADAVLFATPEYNGSVPGTLKNAIDWASRPRGDAALAGKPVAVVGASPGMFGAVWAQGDLRRILGIAGARVIDRELPIPNGDEAFHEDHRLIEDDQHDELGSIVSALVEEASPRFVTA